MVPWQDGNPGYPKIVYVRSFVVNSTIWLKIGLGQLIGLESIMDGPGEMAEGKRFDYKVFCTSS